MSLSGRRPSCPFPECDREFETERGLNIHIGHVHGEEEPSDDLDEDETDTESVAIELALTAEQYRTAQIGGLFAGCTAEEYIGSCICSALAALADDETVAAITQALEQRSAA